MYVQVNICLGMYTYVYKCMYGNRYVDAWVGGYLCMCTYVYRWMYVCQYMYM